MRGIDLINEIEAELSIEFLPGAYAWMDSKRDGAFTNATNRLEKAIVGLSNGWSLDLYKAEIDFYRTTMVKLLREYKEIKKINEIDSFMNSIGLAIKDDFKSIQTN